MTPSAAGPSGREVRELLAASLELWGVQGTVEAPGARASGTGEAVALVRASGQPPLAVRRSQPDGGRPNWRIEPLGDSTSAAAVRCRRHASVIGLLRELREVLGAERAGRLVLVPRSPGD